jgi:hypothetical protein
MSKPTATTEPPWGWGNIIDPPRPKWGKPGRPAKPKSDAPVVKLPRPPYRKGTKA